MYGTLFSYLKVATSGEHRYEKAAKSERTKGVIVTFGTLWYPLFVSGPSASERQTTLYLSAHEHVVIDVSGGWHYLKFEQPYQNVAGDHHMKKTRMH